MVADRDRHKGGDPCIGTHVGKELDPEPPDSPRRRSFFHPSDDDLLSFCLSSCWVIGFMKTEVTASFHP